MLSCKKRVTSPFLSYFHFEMAKKNKKSPPDGRKVVVSNKKARRDYEIVDKLEAGLVLQGSEVKSIRDGGVNLNDAYIRANRGELYLVGCHISPYSHAPADAHEIARDRKLLVHKKEIEKLEAQIKLKGMTLVPMQLYFKHGRCKLEIGLGKGKKVFDKRQDVKKREADRTLQRVMKRQ